MMNHGLSYIAGYPLEIGNFAAIIPAAVFSVAILGEENVVDQNTQAPGWFT